MWKDLNVFCVNAVLLSTRGHPINSMIGISLLISILCLEGDELDRSHVNRITSVEGGPEDPPL